VKAGDLTGDRDFTEDLGLTTLTDCLGSRLVFRKLTAAKKRRHRVGNAVDW
jgi:hypothetical protein